MLCTNKCWDFIEQLKTTNDENLEKMIILQGFVS